MSERRRETRMKAGLGGAVTLQNRNLILSCTVRDVADSGARLEFDSTAIIPDAFDLTIRGRPERYWAQSAWRSRDAIGVTLAQAGDDASDELMARMRAAEQQREALRRRIDELTAG